MSKYFFDTEFLEGTQKTLFGKTKPTIDLISIGIVSEDNREYYAISKDFNLKEAWNRFQLKKVDYHPNGMEHSPMIKEYWIRENVLKPLWLELYHKDKECIRSNAKLDSIRIEASFTHKSLKRLIKKYGKSNEQIAKEIKHFIANRPINSNKEQWILDYDTKDVQFYGYYADYDWVVFCWLFGKMIDLPAGFPMYCIDLKQTLDEKVNKYLKLRIEDISDDYKKGTINNVFDGYHKNTKGTMKNIQERECYPKQTNEHNALANSKWNYKLYKFLQQL